MGVKREKINSIILVIFVVVIFILSVNVEKRVRLRCEADYKTKIQAEIQAKYYISEADTGLIVNYNTYDIETVRHPLIMAKSISLVFLCSTVLMAIGFLLIKRLCKVRFYKFILYFVKWIVELTVIIGGIYTAVYTWKVVDFKQYGLEKKKLEVEDDFKYYQIEEIPYVISNLENEDDTLANMNYDVDKISDNIDKLCVVVSIFGCFTLLMSFIIDYEEMHPDENELGDQIEKTIKDRKILDAMSQEIRKDLEGKIHKYYISQLDRNKTSIQNKNTSKRGKKRKKGK